MVYVNVGGPFEIKDTPHLVEVWGQPVEIPEDLARGAILSGACLLPKDQFDSQGFNEEELKLSNPRLQQGAPETFRKKHAAAIQAAHNYRKQLLAAPPAPPASTKTPEPKDKS